MYEQRAQAMQARYVETGIFSDHPGAKGSTREEVVAEFIRANLPQRVEVYGSAELATVAGDISTQCDVVIADPSVPPFFVTDVHKVVPNECVYGVVEVKSFLDKRELERSCQKFAAIRALPKTAYHRTPNDFPYAINAYGMTWSAWPTTCMIFAFDGSDIDTLAKNLMDWCGPRPVQEWPDCVWVLGKGWLCWTPRGEKRLDYFPEQTSSLLALGVMPNQDVLFPMALGLNAMFAGASMPRFRLLDYAGASGVGLVLGHYEWRDDDPVV